MINYDDLSIHTIMIRFIFKSNPCILQAQFKIFKELQKLTYP
jgi:hypothetical protein